MLLAEALRRLTQVRALEIFMNLERAYLFLAIAFPNVTKVQLCSYGSQSLRLLDLVSIQLLGFARVAHAELRDVSPFDHITATARGCAP
jgi:hypothetical protein